MGLHSRFREFLRHRRQRLSALAHLGRFSSPKCGAVDCSVQSSLSSPGNRRCDHHSEPPAVQPCHGCAPADLCGAVVSWNSMVRALSTANPNICLPSSRHPSFSAVPPSRPPPSTCSLSFPPPKSPPP